MATNWMTNKARYDMLYAYLNGATIKCALLESGYTPSKDHVFASALTNELTCTGYARKTLGTVVISQDDTLDLGKIAAADIVWTPALGPSTGGPIAKYAALIKFVTEDADSPIIAILDVDKQTNGGVFTLSKHVVNAAFAWLA
jgi:hypothetical protein